MDATVLPEIEVFQRSPLTNCDPNRPNGELRASADGQVDGFKFAWYDENNSLVNIGPSAANLSASSYQVQALNIITGCMAETSAVVTAEIQEVPVPDVTVLSDMTRCDVPDGAATASVNGEVIRHFFHWYAANDNLISTSVNHSVENLTSGDYYVTATDRKTGCTSEPAYFTITDQTFLPEFTVSVDPALCEEENGMARIETSVNNLTVDQVIWYSPLGRDIISRLPEVSDLPVGAYPVDIIGSNGCTVNGMAQIGNDINVYNGVSPNGDGDNDIFEIGCIEDYPTNHVKIFNRAGTLVYEATGYDNHSIFFEGYGNQGVYVGGKELPDGTYFYIIEKKDGSKSRTGYLEIVR